MPKTVQRVEIAMEGAGFAAAKQLADEAASVELDEPICLAWVDTVAGLESPPHADCHDSCDVPGAVEYARTRGCELEVAVGGGQYLFCYRSAGEFAGL